MFTLNDVIYKHENVLKELLQIYGEASPEQLGNPFYIGIHNRILTIKDILSDLKELRKNLGAE